METKTPYHDDSNYIDDEFDDDFDSTPNSKQTDFQINEDDDIATVNMKNKLNHKTNTKEFNSFSFEIISPEQADIESKKMFESQQMEGLSPDYADPVIARAVYQIEHKFGRKINYDEFDKLCKTYAAELTNRDALYRGNGEEPNPIDYKLYYDTLIQNKKVKPAYEMRMSKYEDSLVTEIDQLMEDHKDFDSRDLHISRGDPINVRHKGKVYIRDEAHNQEIKIDNKKDVDLLRMRYRQDWIEKKYKNDIDLEINGAHSNDGFE